METSSGRRFAAPLDNLRRLRAPAYRRLQEIAVLAIFLVISVAAQNAVSATPNGEANVVKNPYLYEIRKDGKVSWLFGTYHVGVHIDEVRQSIESRLEKSRVIYFEVFDQARSQLWINNPVEATLTSSSAGFGVGRELALDEKQKLVEIYKIPAAIAAKMTNGSCGAMNEALALGEPRLDLQIIVEQNARGKDVRGLDTPELRERAERLDEEIRLVYRRRQPDCSIADFYLTGHSLDDELNATRADLARYRVGEEPSDDYFPKFGTGVSLRNHAWLETVQGELSQGGVFMAVGMMHLYGELGLIKKLRDQGFEIERVR